jgi:hypothetical protein
MALKFGGAVNRRLGKGPGVGMNMPRANPILKETPLSRGSGSTPILKEGGIRPSPTRRPASPFRPMPETVTKPSPGKKIRSVPSSTLLGAAKRRLKGKTRL